MDGQEIIKRECGEKRYTNETCTRKKWDEIPKALFIHLIESMPKRSQTCVKAGGGNAKY